MKNISSEAQERIMSTISYGGGSDYYPMGPITMPTINIGAVFGWGGYSAPTLAAKTNPLETATHIASQTNAYMSGDTDSDNLYGHCASCHNYEDPYSSSDDGWTGDDYGSSGTSWSGDSDDPGSC